VSAPDHMAPAELAGEVYEIALLIGGLWVLWSCVLSSAAKSGRIRRLEAWVIDPVDFLCYLFFAIVGGLIVSGLVGAALRHLHLSDEQNLIIGSAVLHVGILAGLFLFFRVFGARAGRPAMGPLPADLKSGFATFLIAAPVVGLTSFAWDHVLTALGLPTDKQELVGALEKIHSPVLILILVVAAVVIVPVTEELLFRAGLFRYFRTRMPRWAAVALASAIFAALHYSWSSFVPLAALAAVFCLAYERTGSIRTTMVAHALFNLNTFIIVMMGLSS
jgi:membrane protease YdiL (CAAX protease family)